MGLGGVVDSGHNINTCGQSAWTRGKVMENWDTLAGEKEAVFGIDYPPYSP